MHLPEVWLSFGARIHSDFMDGHADLDAPFTRLFDRYPSAEKRELHAYLSEILGGSPSSERLAELWYGSGAELGVLDEDIRRFLTELLGLLEASLARERVPQ